jgi:hypothetical protein
MQLNTRDLKIISQPVINIRLRIDVYDETTGAHLDQLECGLINGTFSIDSQSDIRRTFNIEATPIKNKRLEINEDGIIWLNRIIRAQIGIYDRVYQNWVWYQQGYYNITDSSVTYDATTNQITINCSDFMCKLDGTKNGQVGALSVVYPAYEEDETTGEVLKYNYIRDAVIATLEQMGHITDYEVDDIGEFKGMPDYNADWEKYREQSKVAVKDGTFMETWNAIPYDLEFSAGCSILSILTEFRDLYPNYEMYFNEEGKFVLKMIPSCYEDEVTFDDKFFDRIYISEDTSIALNEVRNICEVWGQVYDTDYYTESCTYSGNCYTCTIDGYTEKYYNGDIIAVKIPTINSTSPTINVNGFGVISILDENTDATIGSAVMEAGQVYVFKIRHKLVDGTSVFYAYLLGQWQAHGLNVLTDGSVGLEDYTASDGKTVKVYSLEYFKDVYGCDSVEFTTVPDSPYTVQRIGEILDVKTGGEYENITSDSLALARAEYENWKNCRLTDSIAISTLICPFADVNIKVSYRRKDTNELNQYIVKSVSHDISGGTTSWTLMRFYPLYNN